MAPDVELNYAWMLFLVLSLTFFVALPIFIIHRINKAAKSSSGKTISLPKPVGFVLRAILVILVVIATIIGILL